MEIFSNICPIDVVYTIEQENICSSLYSSLNALCNYPFNLTLLKYKYKLRGLIKHNKYRIQNIKITEPFSLLVLEIFILACY